MNLFGFRFIQWMRDYLFNSLHYQQQNLTFQYLNQILRDLNANIIETKLQMLLKDKSKNQKRQPDAGSRIKTGEAENEHDFTAIEYSLQKLLGESADRQQKYIGFIKQQKQQMYEMTAKYAQMMSDYKRQIKEYIAKKQSEKYSKSYEQVLKMANKVPANKYNKIQYTSQSQYELNCKVKFMYIIPVIEDYMKQQFPNKLMIQFTQYFPKREDKLFQIQLNPEISQQQIAENIHNGYPLQLYTLDMRSIVYPFVLTCHNDRIDKLEIINYYKTHQLQFQIVNQESGLIMGFGKIDLQQFLHFNQDVQKEEDWNEKVAIMSGQNSDHIIAYLYTNLSNQAVNKGKQSDKQHIHKISQPISLAKNNLKFQNDRQSRMIQRINQYKNAHHSLIPEFDRDKTMGNEKNVLLHQRKKQLQQIQRYKEINKNQFMDKIFGEAIEQYHTEHIQIGQCKYLNFIFTNSTGKHEKVKLQLSHNLMANNNMKQDEALKDTNKINHQSISIQLIEPSLAMNLLKHKLITQPLKMQNMSIDYSLENGEVFVVNGESIVVFVKVICHTILQNDAKLQVSLDVNNDYGQNLYNNMVIIKTYPPVPMHSFHLHSYTGEVNEIKIQVPNIEDKSLATDNVVGSAKVANVIGVESIVKFQCHWHNNYELLELKLSSSSKMVAGKCYLYYIFVYDINYTLRLACYQFNVEGVEKLQQQRVDIGRIYQYSIKFKLPPLQEQQSLQPKTLVRLTTSDYLKGHTEIYSGQKLKQLAMERNTEYHVVLHYCSYQEKPASEKLIISCFDSYAKKCIKKMAMVFNKNACTYKHIYKLIVPVDKPFVFSFNIPNASKEQRTYKFYSSNYSLMTISQETAIMFPGLNKNVDLTFTFWQKQRGLNLHSTSQNRQVILTIDDGHTPFLYLFELEPDTSN